MVISQNLKERSEVLRSKKQNKKNLELSVQEKKEEEKKKRELVIACNSLHVYKVLLLEVKEKSIPMLVSGSTRSNRLPIRC